MCHCSVLASCRPLCCTSCLVLVLSSRLAHHFLGQKLLEKRAVDIVDHGSDLDTRSRNAGKRELELPLGQSTVLDR